jgi:hypothetical protein
MTGTEKPLPEIEVLRPGTFRAASGVSHTITADDVAALAAGYPEGSAPLVVGHPEINDPAYGWVKGLRVGDDGVLRATCDQVDPAFAEIVNAGRFKNVSVKLSPDYRRLIHIGFLGAAAPAVKGLKPAALSGDADGVEFSAPAPSAWNVGSALRRCAGFFRRLREKLIESDGMEAAENLLPGREVDRLAEQAAEIENTPEPVVTRVAFAAPPAEPLPEPKKPEPEKKERPVAVKPEELSAREAELKAREKALAEREAVAFCDGLVAAAKLPVAMKADAAALIVSLSSPGGGDVAFAFAEGEPKNQGAALMDLLGRLPPMVETGAKIPRENPGGPAVAFAAPAGYSVSSDAADLHAKALAHQKANPGKDYIEAYKAVGGE